MNEQFKKGLFVFKIVMSLVYIAIGLTIIFRPEGITKLVPQPFTPILGILVVFYGCFRGYRAYFVENKKSE